MAEQHLEGAAIAAVRELALEHVEAQLARLGLVAARGHELEARLLIDEAADQPGRRDAIDLHAAAGDPGAVAERAGGRCGLCWRHGILLLQDGLETRHQALRREAPVGAEEIDGDDGIELPAQARHLARHLGELTVGGFVALARRDLARLGRDLRVVLVARVVEQHLHVVVAQALDQGGFADHRLAAVLDDLLGEPGEVLLSLGIGRQRIDRALHRDRAKRLQPPPHLDPRIGGLGGKLMDQQQPGRASISRHRTSVSHHLLNSNECIIF